MCGAYQKDRGFTLIELLVVVAIIALLISVLLPSLSKARETAKTVACASNQKQFAVGNEMYANDSDDHFVPIKTAHPNWSTWIQNEKYRAIMNWRPSGPIPHDLQCPNRMEIYAEPQQWGVGYGFNMSRLWPEMEYQDMNVVHRSSVRWGSGKTQLTDGNYWRYTWSDTDYISKWDPFGELMPVEGGTFPTVAYRHNEGTNFQFFDGHVAWISKEEAWGHTADDRIKLHYVYEPWR